MGDDKVVNAMTYRHAHIALCVIFLIYGLVRAGVAVAMFGQLWGIIDTPDLAEAWAEVDRFVAEKSPTQLVPVTAPGYMAYLFVMGALLTTGALATFLKARKGLYLIGAFLVLWLSLFINFQTVNPKVIHLLVASVLFAALCYLHQALQASSQGSQDSA